MSADKTIRQLYSSQIRKYFHVPALPMGLRLNSSNVNKQSRTKNAMEYEIVLS